MLSCSQSDKIEPEPEPIPTVKHEAFDASNLAQGFNPAKFSMAALVQELMKHINIPQAVAPAQQTSCPTQAYRPRDADVTNNAYTVSTNFVEATHLQNEMKYNWIKPECEDNLYQSHNKHEFEDIGMLKSLIATTQKKIDELKRKLKIYKPALQAISAPKQTIPVTRINEMPIGQRNEGNASQIRYCAAIEDPIP